MDDKQQAILQALAHPETAQMSNRAIARLLGVNKESVRYWRLRTEEQDSSPVAKNVANNSSPVANNMANASSPPQHHPLAQTHQAIAVLNPVKVRFSFMGSPLEGEAVAVLLDWQRLIPCAILVNHPHGQTQVPLRMAQILS